MFSSNIVGVKIDFIDSFVTKQELVPSVTWISAVGR